MEQTSARLRRTFKYPDDGSDDSLPEALDEEEQESLIRTLRAQNASRNQTFTKLFLALPLLCIPAYLPSLFQHSTSDTTSSASTALLALLGITSLLCTAYVLRYLPEGRTGLASLDAWAAKPAGQTTAAAAAAAANTHGPATAAALPRLGDLIDQGPLQLYVPWLNVLLAGLLALAGMASRGRVAAWFALLPGIVYAVVLAAKVAMAGVDVGELERLRYGYKGA